MTTTWRRLSALAYDSNGDRGEEGGERRHVVWSHIAYGIRCVVGKGVAAAAARDAALFSRTVKGAFVGVGACVCVLCVCMCLCACFSIGNVNF